jgi:hypothetical protein
MTGQQTRWARTRCPRAWTPVIAMIAAVVCVAAAEPATAAGKGQHVGSMKVSAGAVYATSTTVTVDSTVTGVTGMRVQNAGGAWSAWGSYAPSTAWTLAAGDGFKTVSAQYRFATGKSLTLSDTIILDSSAPGTTTDYDGLPAPVLTVTLTATDALSGVATTSFRVDGGPWQTGTSVALSVPHKRVGLPAGPHTLEYFSTDVAGNVEPVRSVVVTLGR